MGKSKYVYAARWAALSVALVLGACGGGGGGGSAMPPIAPPTNTAPTIGGVPAATVVEAADFTFTPTASDADGDTLQFSIENAPSWAQFDTASGTLAGTPSIDDQGIFDAITISVSDGEATATLPAFSIEVIDTVRITLVGVVTDAPLVGATVTATVGDAEFGTVSDATGTYTLDLRLRVDRLTDEAPIVLNALGAGVQAQVELISLLPGVAQLSSLAMANGGTLGSAQVPGLAVSHVSTARYLLALDATGGEGFAEFAAVEAARRSIVTQRLLDTAGVIRLINDEGLLDIPAGDTSLSLLRGADGTQERNAARLNRLLRENGLLDDAGAFVADLRTRVDEAVASTLADPLLAVTVTASELAGDSIWLAATAPGRVAARGEVFALAGDGSGRWYEDQETLSFPLPGEDLTPLRQRRVTWSVDAEGTALIEYPDLDLEVAFSEDIGNVEAFGFPADVVEFLQGDFDPPLPMRITYFARIERETAQVIARSSDRLIVRRTRQFSYEIDDFLTGLGFDGPLPRAPIVTVEDAHVMLPASAPTEPFPATAGESWALPVIYTPSVPRLQTADPALAVDLFTLSDDGTTSVGLYAAPSHGWRLTEAGELELSLDDRSYRYRLLERGAFFDLALVSVFDGDELVARSTQRVARAESARDWPQEQLLATQPAYWQDGLVLPRADQYAVDGLLDAQQVDGVLLGPVSAGRLAVVGSAVPECFGFGFPCFTLDDGWVYGVEGSRLAFLDAVAVNLRENAWELLRYDGEREVAVVIEYGILDINGDETVEFNTYPRLSTVERADLATFSDAYEQTLSLGGLDFDGG